ncbi:MAG: hypothetical protein ABR974_01010 [Bacteroidales bacterium]|jgi:hypothetical protein
MKTRNFLLITFVTVLMASCMPLSYYQVYKASHDDKLALKENRLVFQDNNCEVFYNLWSENGNIGFRFYNKTENNIYLNLEQCFFVLNGIAYNYYQNRIFTNSSNMGTTASRYSSASKSITGFNYLDLLQTNKVSGTNSVGVISTAGYSISYNEEKVVCIPPKTSKIISGYSINQSRFRNCDLFGYPSAKQIKTVSFSKDNSPLVFSNIIEYYINPSDKHIQFENEFYVSEITNYPESEMFESRYDEICGQKSQTLTKYFKDVSSDKFYIVYEQGTEFKH